MKKTRLQSFVTVSTLVFVFGLLSASAAAGQVFEPSAIPTVAPPTVTIGGPGQTPGSGGFAAVTDSANQVLYFQWNITNSGDSTVTVLAYANLCGVALSTPPYIGRVVSSCVDVAPHTTMTVKSVLNSKTWCYPNVLVKTACVNAVVYSHGISYLAYGCDQCITYPGDGFSLYPYGAPAGTPTTATECQPSTCPGAPTSTSAAASYSSAVPAFSLLGLVVGLPLVGTVYLRRRKR